MLKPLEPTAEIVTDADGGRVVVQGDWLLANVTQCQTLLTNLLPSIPENAARLDVTNIGRIDGAGAVSLLHVIAVLEQRTGCAVVGTNSAARIVQLYRQRRQPLPGVTGEPDFFENIGVGAASSWNSLVATTALTAESVHAAGLSLVRPGGTAWRDLPRLVLRTGGDGLGIVVMTNLLIGGIMGFQGVMQLANFGATSFVPTMVLIAQVREMAPIMTAIIVAGRSGAGFAAELGSMKVAEEVDALRTLGLDPVRWLVIPRIAALLIALPLLTVIGMAVGLLGGMAAALPLMSDISMETYIHLSATSMTLSNVLFGLLKPFVFAVAIGVLACGQGLAARGGAAAVGLRTTSAVVLSIFSVILIDCVFAMAGTMLGV